MTSSIPYFPDAETNPFAEPEHGPSGSENDDPGRDVYNSVVQAHDHHKRGHDEAAPETESGDGGYGHANDHSNEHEYGRAPPDGAAGSVSTDDGHGSAGVSPQQGPQGDHGTSPGTTTSAGTGSDDDTPVGSIPRRDPGKVKKYKLMTKVLGIERQGKKDPIIRFDAYSTLPRFRTTTFRDVRRTYHEFERFFDHLNGNNPESFVPSLPPAKTSAGAGTEEDDQRVRANLQLWLDRVTSNPLLARDEEFVFFIEADFGYTPVVKRRPPATGITRRAMKQLQPPHDEVTELQEFRPVVKDVYLKGTDAQHKLDKANKTRRALGLSTTDFGAKVAQFGALESHPGMMNMWRKLGKVLTALGDAQAVKATAESVTLSDGLAWVVNDAYVAKEALTNRHLLMRDLIKAQTNTRSRHQTATRVKGSSNLSPVKVDEAIAALEEATKYEEQLTNKVRRVSDNMLLEKTTLLQRFDHDIKTSINAYVLRSIDSERRALSLLESIRIDVRAADASGGLSRLGRESTPANRRATIAQSQGSHGDSWSGDRHSRAVDFGTVETRRPIEEEDDEEDEIGDSADLAVDARNAASLLAGSTF